MHSRDCNPSQRNRTRTKPAVGGLVPEVRMTVEEYLDLLERTAKNVGKVGKATRTIERETRPVRRKAGKAAKGLGKAMKEANKRLRKKNGQLKKGKTQADVARLAHKIRRQKYA
jgi:hypothetical protein